MGNASYIKEDVIKLEFEGDKAIDCFVIGTFDFDGKEYMAVFPDDGSDEVYLYEYVQLDDKRFSLNKIESKDRWEKVAEEFSTIFDDDADE